MPRPKLRLLFGAAVSLAIATPTAAQMNMPPGMHMPGMKMPMPKKAAAKQKTAPAKKGTPAKKGANAKPATKKAPAKKPAAKPQAEHDMSSMPGMEMPPGQTMENMPGMQMPPAQTMPPGQTMPGMQVPPGQTMQNMPGMPMPMATAESDAVGTNLPAGNAPAPPVPTDHAADQVYGSEAMAMGRHHLQTFHGGQKLFQVLNNVMEYQSRDGRGGYQWDSQAWYGGDLNRLWLRSSGDGTGGKPIERVEVHALYSRALDPYFNLQAGVRYDFRPNPSRAYLTAGVEGLAPSFFELEAFGFLSNKGELMARVEGYYDQRITERLILQPRAEVNFAAQNSREILVGAGLSRAELGLRLRYDIRREFAPYVGIQYEAAFGTTRRYYRDAGEDPGIWSFLVGLRTWF